MFSYLMTICLIISHYISNVLMVKPQWLMFEPAFLLVKSVILLVEPVVKPPSESSCDRSSSEMLWNRNLGKESPRDRDRLPCKWLNFSIYIYIYMFICFMATVSGVYKPFWAITIFHWPELRPSTGMIPLNLDHHLWVLAIPWGRSMRSL